MDFAISKKNIPIRLTNERWHHISTGHPEMADFYYEIFETIENPIIIYRGNSGELIALSKEHQPSGKFFVVVYKEMNSNDGFVITAYLSNKQTFLKRRKLYGSNRNK
jgi:hypothetical protein